MTTVDAVLQAGAEPRTLPRPSLAMAVLATGLLLCVAGYAAVAVLVVRLAGQLLT